MKNAIIAAIISAAVSASGATAATKIIVGTNNIKDGAVTYEKLDKDLRWFFEPDDSDLKDCRIIEENGESIIECDEDR